MGKLKGEILLAEDKVRALRKQLRRDEHIKGVSKKELELVFKMAIRQIKLTERSAKFFGKYEECFPDLARGICETFYTDDTELAACFRVAPAMIERWKRMYPDFKNKSRAGRTCFTRQDGSTVCRQRWFRLKFVAIARGICNDFEPTERQFARCFWREGRKSRKDWEEWMQEPFYVSAWYSASVWVHLREIRFRLYRETIDRICDEFNPNNEQLARWVGLSVKEAKEIISARKLYHEKAKETAEAVGRSLRGLPEAETDNEEGEEKQE